MPPWAFQVRATVEAVIEDIRAHGDEAVRKCSEKFDGYAADYYRLSQAQIDEVLARAPQQVLDDIRFVQDQVRRMAERQLESLQDFEIETLPGVRLGQKNLPIRAAGAYIPGGRYPLLASAHMTIVTAEDRGRVRARTRVAYSCWAARSPRRSR